MAAVSLLWSTNMAALTSCENALFQHHGWNRFLFIELSCLNHEKQGRQRSCSFLVLWTGAITYWRKTKEWKNTKRTNNGFRNPNKLIVWILGSLWANDLPKVNEIKVVFIHNIEQQSQMSTVYSFPSSLVKELRWHGILLRFFRRISEDSAQLIEGGLCVERVV